MRKKSENSNLEKRRRNFLNLGFVVATSLTLLAFEYQNGNVFTKEMLAEEKLSLEAERVIDVKVVPPQPKVFKPVAKVQQKGPDVKEVKDVIDPNKIVLVDTTVKDIVIPKDIVWNDNGKDFDIKDYDEPDIDNTIHETVEQRAQYPGGDNALMKFLGNTISYPQKAKDQGQEGVVYVQFVVERDGTMSSIKAVGGSGQKFKSLKKEAIRATGSINKKWEPGMVDGKEVRSYFKLPVRFRLKN